MERLPSGVAEVADSDGRFRQSAQPRGLCILPEHQLSLYCFPTTMAPGSMAMHAHGSSPHHLFFVMRLSPGFSTGGLSIYVTDDSIHKPPKYPETSHQHV